jgi:putative membrane protein
MTFLLAAHDWHHHWWFVVWPLFWLLVLSTLVFVVVRGRRGRWACAGPRPNDPRAILAERYARGEIDADEYRDRLENLDR